MSRVMTSPNSPIEDVVIQLSVELLLSRLEAEELRKPPAQRREVPSIPALALAAGVHRGTMYNLVKGNVKQVSLELLSSIFNELQRRGFTLNISDFFVIYPLSTMQEK